MGGIAQRLRRSKKKRSEQSFHEPAASFASGAVGHLDLGFAKADLRRDFGR
jgi:hypothetical protein